MVFLIEVFKTFKGSDNINAEDCFIADRSNITRTRSGFIITDKKSSGHTKPNSCSVSSLASGVSQVLSGVAVTGRKYLKDNAQLIYYRLC